MSGAAATPAITAASVAAGVMPAPEQVWMGPTAPAPPPHRYLNAKDVCAKTAAVMMEEEIVYGCDAERRFKVHLWDGRGGTRQPEDGRGEEVFRVAERSPRCERAWCGSCRTFEMVLVPSNPSIETFDSGMLSPPTMWGHPDAMHAARLSHTGPIYMRHGSAGRFATITTAGVLCRARYNVHAAALDDGGGGTRIHPAVTPAEHWFTVDGPACQQRYACYCCSGDHRSQLRLQVYAGEDTALRSPIGEVTATGPLPKMVTLPGDNPPAPDIPVYTATFPEAAHRLQRASLLGVLVHLHFTTGFDHDHDAPRSDDEYSDR